MLKSLGTEFKVGLFALVAIATLAYMFFVLNPQAFERQDYATYYTELRNAAGIVSKTHVKTSGVSVGRVRNVKLEANKTRVYFEVSKDVRIPVGSTIEIRSVGFLGDVHLEIVRAENQTQSLEDGGFIPQSEDAVDMQTLVAMVGDIARDIKKVTKTFANVFGSEEGETSVKNVLDNIEGLTADIRAVTKTLKSSVGDRESDVQQIVTDLRDGLKDLRQFSASLNKVLNDANRQRIDKILASFDETMVDVRSSAKNIKLISDKVERGEGTIGRLVNDDAALNELEGAIKDIRSVLAPATRLEVALDYHGELRRDKSSQHYMNVLLRTRPDRFYLIGLTDVQYKDRTTRSTTETGPGENGGPDVVKLHEEIETREALRFNLQFGKRWYFVSLRFGLFESTGGLAADFHLFEDRLRLSVEAFDWDTQDKTKRRTAHFKTYLSALFYNHVYAMVGVDDPTRTDPITGKVDKQINWFAGAGFTFTDSDLKSVLGAAALAAP